MVKKPKILVLWSGGLDSATCLAYAIALVGKENVMALNAYYGQRHKKEIACARKLAEYYGINLKEIDMMETMQDSNCCLLESSDKEITLGSYEEQAKEKNGDPVDTYVPFRNGLLLSVAAAIAYSLEFDVVMLGAHADDMTGSAYPDCSQEFINSMNEAIMNGTAGKVRVMAPFITDSKAKVVEKGLQIGVPFELTWSCYNGGDRPCGKCGTCIDRHNAFEANNSIDPLEGNV